MKIGILTLHDADNYGAILQAYALKEIIKQFNKGSVEIIDYKKPYIREVYKLVKLDRSSTVSCIRSLLENMILLPSRYFKKNKFRKFRKEYMDISAVKFFSSKDISGYDIYIVGSDQVWNNVIVKNDETFFLGFCEKNKRKISYAASLGNTNISNEQLAWLQKYINNIDYISVREDSAVKALTPLTNREVVQVLDPTLLVEQQLWDKCIKIVKLKTPYILLFRIAVNEELYNVANTIAQQIHLPVIYLNYHAFTVLDHSNKPKRYCFKNVRCAGPKEFVTLFKNAKFIVTNSFHGTAFSIIFNKNFVVIPDKNRGNRVTNLLNMLELSERIINNHNQISENFNFEVDYKTANEILNKQKEKSFTFLKKVLET